MSASRAALPVVMAVATMLAVVSGCSDLLGASFDDGHLKVAVAGEQPDASTPSQEASTDPTTDAGDSGAVAPHVVMFGGQDGPAGQLAETWTWDGTTWMARGVSAHPSARAEHAMATLGHTVVLFGVEFRDGVR